MGKWEKERTMINPSGEWIGDEKKSNVVTNRLCDYEVFFFFFFFFAGEVWLSWGNERLGPLD